MYNLRKILRVTSPPRRDSRSFDFASSLDGVKDNRRISSLPRRDSRLHICAKTPSCQKRANERKYYEPVDPQGVTLDLLNLQALFR